MKTDTKKFKTLLETELKTVEAELKKLGRKNPDNPKDWEASPDKMDTLPADENEVADKIESYEENSAIVSELEISYNEIKKALEKIKNNTYGMCEICNEPIEVKRLEANPSATTCIKHIK